MHIDKKTRSLLAHVRSNRNALRKRGLTAADILTLEAIIAACPNGLRRFSTAAVGRMIGIKRSGAHARVARLMAVGAVFRVGSALGVNARGLMQWAEDGARDRLAALKSLYSKARGEKVRRPDTHRRPEDKKDDESCEIVSLSRFDALAQLRATYVPVWLRPQR